jgi:23S rRNA pseudouridine1911/1915/1917 synthase
MGHSLRSDETSTRRELVVAEEGRIDAVLAAADPDLTRAAAQKLLADGLVELNGQVARKSARVVPGDQVAYCVPRRDHAPREVTFDLPVLYEDDEVVAVDKPAGLNVHPGPGDDSPAVSDWLVGRYSLDTSVFDVDHPGIVHRLDRDTSGVLLLARTPVAQAKLSAAFEQRDARKTYLAITAGKPPRERAVIDAAIGRHPVDRTRMGITRDGRESRTTYEILATDRDTCLLLVRPETGRTHQIRVHLAAVGAPVMGDQVYGKGGDGRQMLHAWQLDVPHPAGGRLEVTAPLPDDFVEAVRSIGLETVASGYMLPHPPRRTQD